MKDFFKQAERNFISGALVLLPLIVFFIIIEKVWSFFRTYGEKTAHLLGFDQIFGTAARDVMGGLLLVILFYFSGYLMRLAYLKKFTVWIDDKLMIFLPGYEKNKKIAEEKLSSKLKKNNVDKPVLVKLGNFWQPGLLIEQSSTGGSAAVFVPALPSKDLGQLYVVESSDIKFLEHTSSETFNASIKSFGKGILDFK